MVDCEPVRWRTNILRSWRAAWPAAALACAAGAVLLIFPAGNALRRWSYDLLSSAKPAAVPHEVALVYVDDLSHTRLAQPYDAPWDRRLDARLVRRLNQLGARAIGFDIVFDRPGVDPAADADFADAIRSRSNVVLAATLAKGDYFGLASEIQLTLPVTNLLASSAGWGFAELPIDPDDMVRNHYAGTEEIPSLSWRLAAMLDAPVTHQPGAQRRERWMNYYPGGTDGLPGVSYFRVLEDSDAALVPFFRDKIVIVGAGSKSGYTGKRKDQFRNPQTWLTGRFSPGAEIHATALLNLLRGDWLRRPAWWLELGAILAAGLVLALLLIQRKPGHTLVLAALGVGATFAIAWLAVAFANVWSAWLIVALVQAPIATLWAFARAHPAVAIASDAASTREFRGPTAAFAALPAISDYELIRPIGRGAYGEVWLARGVTGVLRAIKIVHRRGFGTDRAFDREFAGLVNFEPISRQHEGLVQVLHVGRDDAAGCFYYVMELADDGRRVVSETVIGGSVLSPTSTADGRSAASLHTDSPITDYSARTLRAELDRRERLPARECLQLARELAAALAFLHERGLVHRDVKPANLIFVGERLKLADIGLVAEAGEARTLVGTEGYLSPEGLGTPQADVFSAGRVLYEVLTGMEPRWFPDPPRPIPDDSDPVLWQELFAVTRRACAADVVQRIPDGAQLRAALDALGR